MWIIVVASASCRLFNTCDPAVPFSLPTGRMAIFIQICNSPRVLYVTNELATMAEVFVEFARQKMKAVLVLFSLKTYVHILFQCFIASASSWPFQTLFSRLDILPSCDCFDLFARQVSLASQTFSISMAALIAFGYECWKRLALCRPFHFPLFSPHNI